MSKSPASPTTPLAVVILAAGKGTRMKSELPKVLHPLAGKPMLWHVLTAVQALSPAQTVVVTGHHAEEVETAVTPDFPTLTFVRQQQQNGTGHAVQQGEAPLANFSGTVLIVCGDVPLMRTEALAAFIKAHQQAGNQVSVASTTVTDPFGLGRILRDDSYKLVTIREQKDCSETEANVSEVNTGIYAVEAEHLFSLLAQVTTNNSQGEYYLTDIVPLGLAAGLKVDALPIPQPAEELAGVNTPEQLAEAERIYTSKSPANIAFGLFETKGLVPAISQLLTTATSPVEALNALSALVKSLVEGKGQTIKGTVEKGAILHGDIHLGEGSTIHSGAVVEGPVYIGNNVTIRPHANVRHGTYLCDNCVVGHSADIKNALCLNGSKIQDGTYAGDSIIGHKGRVGSGVILANRKFNQSAIRVDWGEGPQDSARDFLGTFLGDQARLGANVIASPGTVVGPHTWVGSGAVIKGYLPPDQLITVKQELETKPKDRIDLKAGQAITYDID